MDFDYFSKKLLKKATGQPSPSPAQTSAANSVIDVASEAAKMASSKRMLDASAAEQNERRTSQSFSKMGRGGSPSGESARADMYHREMQGAAEELNRLRRKGKTLTEKLKEMQPPKSR